MTHILWTKFEITGHSGYLYASEYTPRHSSDADACFVYISAYFFSHNELMRFEFASVFQPNFPCLLLAMHPKLTGHNGAETFLNSYSQFLVLKVNAVAQKMSSFNFKSEIQFRENNSKLIKEYQNHSSDSSASSAIIDF